jgi:hypothetical protein
MEFSYRCGYCEYCSDPLPEQAYEREQTYVNHEPVIFSFCNVDCADKWFDERSALEGELS